MSSIGGDAPTSSPAGLAENGVELDTITPELPNVAGHDSKSIINDPEAVISSDRESRIHHIHEFGKLEGVVHLDSEFKPRLIQKPRFHQYMKDGRIHRPKAERPVDQFELFLDLVMVGVVHQLAESSAESLTGLAIVRFVLCFWGAWSIWTDYRDFVNFSGMDDFPQRIYTFCIMGLLLGYTSNATGIELEPEFFDEGSKSAIQATLGFFLVAKCIRLVFHAFYGLYLEDFRVDQLIGILRLLFSCSFYLGAIFSHTLKDVAILFGVGAAIEIFLPLTVGFQARNITRKDNSGPRYLIKFGKYQFLKPGSIAAINIEHLSERNSAFYTIVLGESVAEVLYNVHELREAIGMNPFYGRAVMVLIVAYGFNWLYFTRDWGVSKTHPIRRGWLTSWLYKNTHWPLCASLILASAGVSKMVTLNSIDANLKGLRWYFGGGTAVALLCLTVLELLPQWDHWTTIRQIVLGSRVFFRLGAVAICATIPLVDSLNDLQFLGIYASVFSFLGLTELGGKLILLNESNRRLSQLPAQTTEK